MKRLASNWFWVVIVFGAVGFLIYANALNASFRFDDFIFIADKMQVREVGRIWREGDLFRKIPYLTFALNYQWTGLKVWSWHLVNVVLHVAVSLTVYGLAAVLWRSRALSAHPLRTHARSFALASGLIFLCHPLATSAVTYIYQRIMVIAALFHLLALYTYLKARVDRRPLWYLGTVVFTGLACFSKQVNMTLPLTLLLCEVAFGSKSILDFFRRNWAVILAAVGLALYYLSVLQIDLLHLNLDALRKYYPRNVNSDVSWSQWIPTQINVARTYLRLFVFPINQMIDYDYPLAGSLFEKSVLFSAALWAGLFAAAAACWKRQRMISFGILFVAAALTIEFAAIRDVIFEHRAYLPLAGFAFAVPQAIGFLSGDAKRCRITLAAIVAALGIAAVARNAVWADEELFWKEGIRLAPHKGRPYYSLGVYHALRGEHDTAIVQYRKALQIWPNYADAISNLGKSLEHVGNMPEAIHYYRRALEIDPTLPEALNNYGSALVRERRYAEARLAYEEAIRRKPDNFEAMNNMGSSYAQETNYDEALRWYARAIRANPLYADSYNNVGSIHSLRENYPEAEKYFKEAIRLKPESFEARNNLAIQFVWQKRYEDARAVYTEVLRLRPDYPEANNNMGSLLAWEGKLAEAVAYYRKAIQSKPDFADAMVNLANAYSRLGQKSEAERWLQSALALRPGDEKIVKRLQDLATDSDVNSTKVSQNELFTK